MISRGLGICPNKLFEEVYAEAEISKTSISGQECPACGRLFSSGCMLLHSLILCAISNIIDAVMLYPFTCQEASYEVSFNQGNRNALGNF